MILEQDIRSAIWELMKTKWPEGKDKKKEYRYYMRDVKEGYVQPCFFILVDLEDESPGSVATVLKRYKVSIQYYEENHMEKHTVKILNGLREMFLYKRALRLRVKDRWLEVRHLSYDYVGSRMDIPEITFELEFFDSYATPQTGSAMEDIHIKETVKASN